MSVVPGLFRLIGRDAVYESFSAPLTLGRRSRKSFPIADEPEDESFLEIGQGKTLSRRHAVISWNAEQRVYFIQCLSKNGLFVNDQPVSAPDAQFCKLEHKAKIQIADLVFFFVLPEIMAENPDEKRQEIMPLQRNIEDIQM